VGRVGAVFFVTESIVNLNGVLFNQVFPFCGRKLEEENTTTLQNSYQIYYIYIYIYFNGNTGSRVFRF